MKNSKYIRTMLIFVIFLYTLFTLPVEAQDVVTYYKPITEIHLDVKELTMDVGEEIKLPLTYTPEETPNVFLDWFMNEKIIHIDPETLTVTALSAGKTRLLVESNLGFSWDYCDITVTGSQSDASIREKAVPEMTTLSETDRNKIKAETLLNFLDFIENSDFTPEEYTSLMERFFNVTADVKPGSAVTESEFAASLGMKKALALTNLDAVSLYGTAAQILTFTENNDDLIELFEFEPINIDDHFSENWNSFIDKSIGLKGHVEELTSVNTAHQLGLTGKGTVIAVIDTGIAKNYEDFKDRVIAEECFALEDNALQSVLDHYEPVCEKGSSFPSKSQDISMHNHGSHVTGIAAGKYGIAPDAEIVSINVSVERCSNTDNKTICAQSLRFDLYEVADYLVNLQNDLSGKPIVAANLSIGDNNKYSDSCDNNNPYRKGINYLANNGIIPVVSSGNNFFVDGIASPACISKAFSVGALADDNDPKILVGSNHSKLIDILAPGENINSVMLRSVIRDEDGSVISEKCSGNGCYETNSGTSMAAPMVTGAFAILKQAFPKFSSSQLEAKLKSMSTKTANLRVKRENGEIIPVETFDFDKPVLDFSNISVEVKPIGDVYYISNAAELNWVSDEVAMGNSFKDRTIILTENIDLSGKEWTPIGTRENPFMGNFYGDRYAILNLNLDGNSDYNGLFGFVKADNNSSVTIKDVRIEDVSKTNTSGICIGALIGEAWNSRGGKITVSGCSVTGSLRGNIVGGLIGTIRGGNSNSTVSIKNIHSNVEIKMTGGTGSFGGGIIAQIDLKDHNYEGGFNGKVTVEDCKYQENISTEGRWGTGGGIVGRYVDSNPDVTLLIKHCLAEGEVRAGSAALGGGIVSTIPAELKVVSCVSYMDVYGYNSGCITSGNAGVIEECYANGIAKAMLGGENGGITAYNNGRIFNSYNEGKAPNSSALSYNGNIAASGNGTVENTYNIGPAANDINTSVAQSHPGIFGYTSGQTLINSYYDNTDGGYIFGNIRVTTVIYDDSNKIYSSGGMPTENMKTRWSYSGWDFDNVWEFDSRYSRGYPTLRSIKDLLKKNPDENYTPDPNDSTENEYPIILVEGYMGSNLYTKENGGDKIWAPSGDLLDKIGTGWQMISQGMDISKERYPHNNELNLQDIPNLYAYDLEAEGAGTKGTFGKLIQDLLREFPSRPIYLFSYDFRQNNTKSGEALYQQIKWVLEKHTGINKVDIIAHSNGGLVVASMVMAHYTGPDSILNAIDKIITCGTPYEGTAVLVDRALTDRTLHTVEKKSTDDQWLSIFGLISDVKRKFPSVPQLAPTGKLFSSPDVEWTFSDLVLQTFPRVKDCPLADPYTCTDSEYKDLYIINKRKLSQTEFDEICSNLSVFGNNYTKAKEFHKALTDMYGVNILSVLDNTYFIVGNGIWTPKDGVFGSITVFNSDEYYLADVDYTQEGDGTVPLFSATMGGRLKELKPDQNGVERFKQLENVDHGGTVKNIGARDHIIAILSENSNQSETDTEESISTKEHLEVLVSCPVEVHIEHNGDVLDSSVENMSVHSIFGRLDYAGIEGDIKVLCLDRDLYQIQMQGIDEGEMDLSLEWYDENEKLVTEKQFLQIPISSTTKMSVDTNEEGRTILNVDNDGDGTVDEEWYAENGEVGYQIKITPVEPENPVEPEEPEEPEKPVEPEEPLPQPNHQSLSFFRLDTGVLPKTGFPTVRSQALEAMPKNMNYKPLQMTLEIPGLSVESTILEVPYVDVEYAVDWLGDAVGLLEGSALPGNGITVLAAHNHLNNTENGPFALLSSMSKGERIFIRDKRDNLQTYVVYANEKIAETNLTAFKRISEAFENAIVMITCEDERVDGGYANRRIVAARLMEN